MTSQAKFFVTFVVLVIQQATSQAIVPTIFTPDRNVTASGGDDVLLECRQTAGAAMVSWRKDGVVVEASDTYRDGRVYMAKSEGMLILNTELWDRGLYTCTIVHSNVIVIHRLWLDIAPPIDSDVHSNSAFQCGYPRVRGKVVGGKVSNEGQSPWTALLWNTVHNEAFCGAVLLNRRWVVTAAHCFSLSGLSKDDFEIRLGEHDTQTIDGYERTFRAEQIIKHPNYNEQTYDSDIALIKLQQPVTYTDHIIPLCLPSELRAEELLQSGLRGFVTGWGHTAEDRQGEDYSRFLRKVRLAFVSQQECGNRHSDIITNNMFCADGGNKPDSRDACHGDSGGPFVTKDKKRWYLLGIVSWGIGCARPEYPGVYTRVHRFRQWIMDLIQQDMITCEESSFEMGEDLRASTKEANNLRLLNQEQSRQIEHLQAELIRKNQDIFELRERELNTNCENPSSTTSASTVTSAPQSTTSPPTTEARPVTTMAPIPEVSVPCRHNMCWHVSVRASCHGGLCVCNSPDHSRITCLPSVGACHIYQNNSYALARASFRGESRIGTTFACKGDRTSNIHIISVHEGPHRSRPPAPGDVRVQITGGDQGPLTLLFSSYEPVRWLVNVDQGIVVERVILTAYYLALSSVELSTWPSHPNTTVVKVSRVPFGYGLDSSGTHTADFLKYVRNTYGEIGSFTGTLRADEWVLTVPGAPPVQHSLGGLSLPLPMARVQSPLSYAHWTRYSFRYDSSWCACDGGDQYVRMLGGGNQPGFGVKFVGVVLCQTPNRYKIFLSSDLTDIFLNIGDSHGRGHDHCEFVGAQAENESFTLTANDFFYVPTATGYYRDTWGSDVTVGTIGGGIRHWTGRTMVGWYDCGVPIP
ncbi:uncharacterized protein [Diadema antillarum]|uniref:uncharacterized protein n=1 Tax=Diadema antillarum TaxID=105358 RepID=UPI003A895EA0